MVNDMSRFRNLRLMPKLIGSFALVALIAGVVGLSGFLGLHDTQTELIGLTHATPRLITLLKADSDINAAIALTRGSIMTFDMAQATSAAQAAQAARTDGWTRFQLYAALTPSSAADRTKTANVRTLFQYWVGLNAKTQQLSLSTDVTVSSVVTQLSLVTEAQAAAQLQTGLQDLVNLNQASVDAGARRGQSTVSRAINALTGVLTLALLLALGLGWFITRSVAQRERAAADLRASEARLRAVYQGLPLPTLTWQRQGAGFVLIDCNRAAEQISHGGIGSLLGTTAGAMYVDSPSLLQDFMRCWDEQQTIELETPYRLPTTDEEKTVVMTYVYVAPDMVLQHSADITERAKAQASVTRHLAELSALRAIDVSITGSLDLELTLGVVLDQVMAQLGVDATGVLQLSPHTHRLEYAATRGFRGAQSTAGTLRLGEGHAGLAALERRRIHVPDVRSEHFVRRELFADEQFVTYFALPLIAKGEVKGVLEVFQRTALEPEPHWLQFLETLAGQAAIAIDNVTLFEGLQRSNLDLSLAYDTTIEGWSRALDLRDKETEGHSQRVTELTLALARSMGMSDADLVHVRRGALLHDIGKMGVPDNILLKPGALSDEEWAVMRMHPTNAYQLLAPISYLQPALDIPYCHHERWDGAGYPRGLMGEAIPLAARVFAVADVWDALRSDRPYRAAWPAERVREHIYARSGSHFDPRVVQAFLAQLADVPLEYAQRA